MAAASKPCSSESEAARPGLPEVYYPLHSLLHTLRTLEQHQDQICTLLTDIQRSGKAGAAVRRELTTLLEKLPTATLDAEVHQIWSALEAA